VRAVDSLLTVAVQVWILFALIGVGSLTRRLKLLSEAGASSFANVLVLIVTPCLTIEAFQRPFETALLHELAIAFAFTIGLHLVLIAIAGVSFRARDDAAPVLKLATVFSNAGFMGIPLEQALFGAPGVIFGIVYVATFNLFIWSWGLMVSRRDARADLRTTFVNPGTVGLAVALGLFLASIRLPPFFGEPVRYLSLLNTPLAMLVIGYHLAGAKFAAVLRRPSALAATALRLVFAPLFLIACFWPFRAELDRTMMLALVTGSSAPVAAMVSIFAARDNRDVDLSVALVCGTTILSILTMPLVITLAMAVL